MKDSLKIAVWKEDSFLPFFHAHKYAWRRVLMTFSFLWEIQGAVPTGLASLTEHSPAMHPQFSEAWSLSQLLYPYQFNEIIFP